MLLRVGAAVCGGMEELHVGTALAREELRVEQIIAFPPAPRAKHRTRIRDDDLVAECRQLPRHPRGMCSRFNDDAAAPSLPKILCDPLARRRDARFSTPTSPRIHFIDATTSI